MPHLLSCSLYLHSIFEAPTLYWSEISSEDKVISRANKMVNDAAEDLMKSLCYHAELLPNGTNAFTLVVSKILTKTWRHNLKNTNLFR